MADKLVVSGARGASTTEMARKIGTFIGADITPTMTDAEVLDAPLSVINELLAVGNYKVIDPALVATTANITLSGLQTIDGVELASGDRVLVKAQTTPSQNGLWVAGAGIWARAADFDSSGEVVTGSLVQVLKGSEAGSWVLTTSGTITPGTTAQTWRAFYLRSASKIPYGTGSITDQLALVRYAALYGFDPANSLSANMAAVAKAIEATPDGGHVVIGKHGTTAALGADTLGACVQLARPMTVDIYGTIEAAGKYIFNVTGDDVAFGDTGTITGDGTLDTANSGDDSTFPTLVTVTGKGCKFGAMRFDRWTKVAVALKGAAAAETQFFGTKFTGGPIDPPVGDTGYFGVLATGCGEHKLLAVRFGPGADGGKPITGFFAGGIDGPSDGNLILGGSATCHEKIAYIYGSRNRVALCHIYDCIRTDVCRFVGHGNKMVECWGENVWGVMQALDGSDSEIAGCKFGDIWQTAVSYQRAPIRPGVTPYAGGLHRLKVTNCQFTAKADSHDIADGILLYAAGNDADDFEVTNTMLVGFAPVSGDNGIASIRMQAEDPYIIRRPKVQNPRIRGSQVGVRFARAQKWVLDGGDFADMLSGGYPAVRDATCGPGTFTNNRGTGGLAGGVGMAGLTAEDESWGNKWTDKPTKFVATIESGQSQTTTTHGGLPAGAMLVVTPINDAACLSVAANGLPKASVTSDGNLLLQLVTGNTAPSQLRYMVQAIF